MYEKKAYKGISFEALVGITLREACQKYSWSMLSDVRLESQSARGYTQIDFLVFTPSRYYCIETKDWDCTVVCSTERYWTAKYKRVLKTLNPVVQNNNHMEKICKRIPPYRVEGIVCFSNSTKLEQRVPNVMNLSEMLIFLEAQSSTGRIISEEDVKNDFLVIAEESSRIKTNNIDLSQI